MAFGEDFGHTEGLIPLVGERDEVRIAVLPQLLDGGGQRVVKVFVIAAAKAVTGHDDVTAKWLLGGIQVHQGCAFGG
jgi:hypothetical protein